MDPNNPQQPIVQQTPPMQEPPIASKHFHLPRVLMILFVALLAASISGAIFYMYGKSQGQLSVSTTPVVSNTTVTKVTPQSTIIPAEITPTSTQTDTSNWQTYTNQQFGITLKYPSQYLVSVSDNNNIALFTTTQADKQKMDDCLKQIECNGFNFGITFDQKTFEPGESIQNVICRLQGYTSNDQTCLSNLPKNSSRTSINGFDAYTEFGNQVTDMIGAPGVLSHVYIDVGKSVLYMQAETRDVPTMQIFEKMVTTFKSSQ